MKRCLHSIAPPFVLILCLTQTAHTQNACTVPPSGLVGWWPGDGNANDIVGNDNGTLVGGVTFAPGEVGQAFSFDGVTGAVVAPDAPALDVTQQLTVEAWVYPTAISGSDDVAGGIVSKDLALVGNQYVIARRNADSCAPSSGIPTGNIAFAMDGISGLPNECRGWVDGGAALPLGAWSHIALTFDSNFVTVYVNGAVTRQIPVSGTLTVLTGPLTIGGRNGSNNSGRARFAGEIDEVDIFNRALSASEILAIYNAGSAGKCTAPTDTVGPITSNVSITPDPLAVNTGSSLSATVSDATTGGSNVAAAYYSINGGTSPQMLLTPSTAVTTQASANLAPFSQSNVYNVCVQGTDSVGNTGANACILLPVYDPSGSFVTGGGQVPSPIGADLLNPSTTGPATFGFVSKYLPGRNTPSGNLEFQYKAGNLDFKSTSMDWLVVTGEPRAQFHGVGTINGTNVCNFQVDAWAGSFQGNADAFGLTISSCSNGGDRYKLLATALTGGSIIIHK